MHLFNRSHKKREMLTAREPVVANQLTVLELFQSQGCSSCPPTNDHVLKRAEDPNTLVLTYDVTYWDHLGWKDTFGKTEFDARQWAYARSLGKKNVYTPQVIINGRVDGVGNTPDSLQALLAQGQICGKPDEPTVGLLLYEGQDAGPVLTVAVESPAEIKGTVLLIRYDHAKVEVPVKRGENGGRTLVHRNIVREIQELGPLQDGGQEFSIPPSISDGQLGMAVLVQEGEGGAGRILAASRR